MNTELKQQKWIETVQELSNEVFKVSLLSYFLLLIIEELREGFVSYHLDFNSLLTVILVSGFVAYISPRVPENSEASLRRKFSFFERLVIIFISMIVGVAVYLLMKPVGRLSLIMALLAVITVVLVTVAMDGSSSKESS